MPTSITFLYKHLPIAVPARAACFHFAALAPLLCMSYFSQAVRIQTHTHFGFISPRKWANGGSGTQLTEGSITSHTGHSLAGYKAPVNRRLCTSLPLGNRQQELKCALSGQLLLRPYQLLGELLQRDVEKEFTSFELYFRRKQRAMFFCVLFF